jgi:hypothetical protein
MNVVTISAAYGAAGSVVGPAVAERLGVPFFDRAIPTAVAEELGIAFDHAASRDEQVPSRLWRWLAAAAPLSAEYMFGTPPPRDAILTDERFLSCTQQAIRRCVTEAGGGVILGRAGAIVLRGHPSAVHVRLDGDPERRIRQAMTILTITEAEARAALEHNDQARSAYVRHFYRADAADPEHYHLVLDSTRIPLPRCVDLIVAAATAGASRVAEPSQAVAAPAAS